MWDCVFNISKLCFICLFYDIFITLQCKITQTFVTAEYTYIYIYIYIYIHISINKRLNHFLRMRQRTTRLRRITPELCMKKVISLCFSTYPKPALRIKSKEIRDNGAKM